MLPLLSVYRINQHRVILVPAQTTPHAPHPHVLQGLLQPKRLHLQQMVISACLNGEAKHHKLMVSP